MSTLRINNIEAKSVPASPTIDEKVKITNSSGDVLIHIDGKTSGITTIGINTTAGNIKFDANSNVVVTGIITATKFVGEIEPTNLTVSGKVSVGGSVTAATFYGDGSNLTGLSGVSVANQADNRLITATGTTDALNGEANLTFDGSTLGLTGSQTISGNLDIASDIRHIGDTNTALRFPAADTITAETNGSERLRIASDGKIGIGTVATHSFEIFSGADHQNIMMVKGTNAAGNYAGVGVYQGNAWFTGGGIGSNSTGIVFRTAASGSETERLRITSAGKIGINTASPTYGMHLHGTTASSNAYYYAEQSTAGASAGFRLKTTGSHFAIYGATSGSALGIYDYNAGAERLTITSTGNLLLGTSTAAISAGKGLMIADPAGARIKLCDSDQGVTASDGFEIIQSNNGTGYIYNRENQAIIFGTNNTERMRITHEGSVGIGTDGSTYELEVHDGTGAAALRMKDGANNVICDLIANSNGGLLRTTYNHPLIFHTNQVERLRIQNDGKTGIGYNAPRQTLEVNSTHDSTANKITPVLRLSTGTGYSGSNTGSGLEFGTTSTSYPTWIKGRIGAVYNGSSNYGGHLVFETNTGSAAESSNSEKMRISDKGLITNTTSSSHPQGAGTFEIKGVINQYSQGSGSGLIFDCDFGRITGYGDDTNVGNGTNLSACLSHSTTDWTSSNSNTPITVNGGTFQYRVGFGGYFDCISNGGRVSVAAGSGNPAMSDKLNTAAMTIETWVWYDGDGREVIVSRYGSGFPNQFNMLCDPNGQFHYNNTGVGAGGGNVSGEHFPDKTWHHHLWQYESGVNRWYINGAFANSRSAGSSLAVNSQTGFAIASRADQMEDWRGKIAIVRIYNRALSATEIKNHFELERGRFGV